MANLSIVHDTVYAFVKAGTVLPDTIHHIIVTQSSSATTTPIWVQYVPPLLSGLLVGIVAAIVSFHNSNRNIRADIYLKSMNDWKNDIMRYFSEIAAELKISKDHRNTKLVRQNISLLRLLLNVNSYSSHKTFESKLIEIEMFLNGSAEHISDDGELEQLINTTREAAYVVGKEAWDSIQKTLHIQKKKKGK